MLGNPAGTGRSKVPSIPLYLSSEGIHPAACAFDNCCSPLAARTDPLSYAECDFELRAHALGSDLRNLS